MDPSNDDQPANLKAAASRRAIIKSLASAGLDGVGALLFAAKYTGEVALRIEEQGVWSRWTRPAWDRGGPKSTTRMAVSTIHSGLQFCGLDDKMELWSTTLLSHGVSWMPWEIPGWTNAPPLNRVAAVQLTGPRVFWGIKASDDSLIFSNGPDKPGEQWEPWRPWVSTGMPKESHLIDITAAQQNDGRAAFWALDHKFQLRCCYERTVGGPWTDWSAPNWNGAPQLTQIAACRQGAALGAGLWGIQRNGRLVYTSQTSPGGNWSEWKYLERYLDGPPVTAVTATQQMNGMVRVWVVELFSFQLWTIAQTSPSGAWGQWENWPIDG